MVIIWINMRVILQAAIQLARNQTTWIRNNNEKKRPNRVSQNLVAKKEVI